MCYIPAYLHSNAFERKYISKKSIWKCLTLYYSIVITPTISKERSFSHMKTINRFRQIPIEYSLNMALRELLFVIRQIVNTSRWRKGYDDILQSLADRPHRPHHHPNQRADDEPKLISNMRRNLQTIWGFSLYKKSQSTATQLSALFLIDFAACMEIYLEHLRLASALNSIIPQISLLKL